MPAITISRKLGSLGSQIAHNLADHLGYKMVWREVINKAACRSCEPEVALAVIDELGLLGLRPSKQAERTYHAAVKRIMEELVTEGEAVIVGRAGQVILRDYSDVLHVRIIAPKPLRIERVAARQQIAQGSARAQIEKSDTTRRKYLRRHYNVDWDDPELYDLVLNTQRITIPMATDLIASAWRRKTEAHNNSEPA